MTPYYADPLVTLYPGDCLEVMAGLEADSVDAVVTDPPYGLEFMGKGWDGSDGFRRSLNPNDAGRNDVFGRASRRSPEYRSGRLFAEWCEQWGREALRVTRPGGYLLAFGGTRTHHRLVCALEDAGWIIRDELTWIYASGFPKGKANLKPAHEPIVLARKPGPLRPLGIDECRIATTDDLNGGSYSGELRDPMPSSYGLKRGIGEYVPPPGRWPSNVLLSDPELFDEPNPYVVGGGAMAETPHVIRRTAEERGMYSPGTRPVGEVAGYGDSGGYSRFFIIPKADRAERERGLTGVAPSGDRPLGISQWEGQTNGSGKTMGPSAPRANIHPTVKPIDLMRHLVRLVTPPGGVVLDPFLGSGTTALAASEEGFRCIGIEREPEYLEIAKGRLMATPMGFGLTEVPA